MSVRQQEHGLGRFESSPAQDWHQTLGACLTREAATLPVTRTSPPACRSRSAAPTCKAVSLHQVCQAGTPSHQGRDACLTWIMATSLAPSPMASMRPACFFIWRLYQRTMPLLPPSACTSSR